MIRTRLALSLWIVTLVATSYGADTGQIIGGLADAAVQTAYAGEAAVFICDPATGYPYDRHTRKSFDFSRIEDFADRCWFAVTDNEGTFQFDDVPPGKYRLVAQCWSGTKGLPELPGRTSTLVHLLGVAEGVEVKADERAVAYVKQLGRGTLRITNDPDASGAFLILSLGAPPGDPILGPFGWGEEFTRQIIGATHMDRPNVTLFGLPDDRPVHAALFAYDNISGVGGATYQPGQCDGTMPIIAAWSNGKHDPPERLKALTDHLMASSLRAADFRDQMGGVPVDNSQRQGVERALYESMRKDPNRLIAVPGLGNERLVDVLAALAYVELQKAVKAMHEPPNGR